MDKLVPSVGESLTVIDRLLEYVASFDPDLINRIQGAPLDMITLYAQLAGFSGDIDLLPKSYFKFLCSMGLSDGGLLHNRRIEARLPLVIKLYQDCLRSEPDSLNSKLPIVGTYIIGDQISFDCLTNLAEPEVVESSDGELIAKISRSWEYLIMQAAILHIEERRLPNGRWFSSSPKSAALALPYNEKGKQSAAEAIDLLFNKLGLELAWPSDSKHRIAIGKELTLFSDIGMRNDVMLSMFFRDERMLSQIEAEVLHALGATGDRK